MPSPSWHHAYNGIPTLRERTLGTEERFAGDRAPSGHDLLQPKDLSGEMDISITVASPTVPGQRAKDGRVVVASRAGAVDGARDWDDATIPVTALKGALSSAYEAVTASRMRVFSGHDRVLTHRRTPQESTTLYPVFLVPAPVDREGTGLRARIMLGKNPRPEQGRWNHPKYVCAVVLPDSEKSRTALYDKSGRFMYAGAAKEKKRRLVGSTSEGVRARLGQLRVATPHLSRISFSAQEEKFYSSRRLILASVNGERFCGTVSNQGKAESSSFTGYVVRLTPSDSAPLIDTKLNEFIFFDTKKNRTHRSVSSQVLDHLVEILHSYLENIRLLTRQESRRRAQGPSEDSKTRASDAPRTWLIDSILSNGGPGLEADRPAIEQHIRALAAAEPGVPLFASLSDDGEITGLYVSQVGRRVGAGAVAPSTLAESGGISPARDYAQASPADRVWGFVADEKLEAQGQAAAVHGRITIHPIVPTRQPEGIGWLRLPKDGSTGWVLPTLASPKPATGAPYLHTKNGAPLPEEATRGETYTSGQRLIRKVYPSHRRFIGQQVGRVPGTTSLSDRPEVGQSAVGSYLAPGARFTASISFEGLTEEELAILVWLLTPERLVPRGEKRASQGQPVAGFHRLGFGKPLGLGMVEIRATDVVARTGAEMAELYCDLTGCLGAGTSRTSSDDDGQRRVESCLDALPEDFESRPAVQAFVRAAFGWEDGAAVRYPDAHLPVGEDISPITAWFKAREENRVKHQSEPSSCPVDSRFHLPGLVDSDAPRSSGRRGKRRRSRGRRRKAGPK
ncbi:hypothetical protein ABXS69_09385 [Actinomyces timonensis]|uniref:CRISPR-associated protein n=1 Tax=Actinomyces timonensis TaxID=1288391 RepID=A0AAU8N408_9ACTO